ncbi:MAG: hypothetical protein HOQ24_07425 [Mycobacteriaceae bacterium]|nr:hypothetical protein [Mycobacteriaceae bacterium]
MWWTQLRRRSELNLLKQVRTAVTHRAIASHSFVGGGPPVTQIGIDGKRYDVVELTANFAAFAEAQFEGFVEAVLADFP